MVLNLVGVLSTFLEVEELVAGVVEVVVRLGTEAEVEVVVVVVVEVEGGNFIVFSNC